MKHFILKILSIAASLALTNAAHTQTYTDQTPPELREQWYAQHEAMKEQSLFQNLPWQFLGPTNISGRMTDVAVVEPKGENYTIYVAGATGGVWRTRNEGITWEPVFEHGMSTSIGDVTLAPSNQDIVWIGTGEANIFRSSHAGAGVYKSNDGGDSWTHMGLTNTNTIPRIIIHPTNPDIVYVAASGNEWTDNPDRGLYKTTDGGKNWDKILFISKRTGVIDLVMHPDDPEILYASTWQRIRRKWNDPRVEQGHDESTILMSKDGGATWEDVSKGLVEPTHRGRIGIDICRSQPNTLYAFVDNYETAREPEKDELDSYGRQRGPVIRGATIFRSDDAGQNWKQVSEQNDYMEGLAGTYGWVFGQIRVDPNNPEKIYVMGVQMHVSKDGGKTYKQLRGMHGDHHGLWIDPDNSKYIVNTNDGGVAISYDGKNFRTFYDDFPLVQFFNVSFGMDDPFTVIGSIQDHGSFMSHVDLSNGRHNIPAVEWKRSPGGEGTRHAIDPTDADIIYSSTFYGRVTRRDLNEREAVNILPKPDEGELAFRGQWLSPTMISPHNPRVIYHGMNFLFRSMNRGTNWERISPDLTYNNPDKYGDIPYQTIFTIAESHFNFGTIFIGTDDGRIHRTFNHGTDWEEITSKIPVHQWVSRIIASTHTDGTLYLTQNGKRDDDFAAYVWKSTDHGSTWQNIKGDIPCGPVNAIAEDPKNSDVLYLGTDLGVYVSLNAGNSWQVLANDFPTTFVHDVKVHPREDILIAATEGRGMYAMDVRPIQEMTDEMMANGLHVFASDPVKLARRRWFTQTPAHVAFHVQQAGAATIKVKNSTGKLLHEWKHDCSRGYNAVTWDLMEPNPKNDRRQKVKAGTYVLSIDTGAYSASCDVVVLKA